MPAGRPSIYNLDLAKEICRRIAEGETLNAIARTEGMPCRDTIHRWRFDYPEFSDLYMRARECQAWTWVDECIDIADENEYDMTVDESGKPVMNWEHIKRSELRVNTRKWAATKIAARIFGDLVKQEITGPAGKDLEVQMVVRPDRLSVEEWTTTWEKQIGNKS